MLKLFDAEYLLEHVEELLFGQNALTIEWLHSSWSLVLVITCEEQKCHQ
jgi:hypothetical protein